MFGLAPYYTVADVYDLVTRELSGEPYILVPNERFAMYVLADEQYQVPTQPLEYKAPTLDSNGNPLTV